MEDQQFSSIIWNHIARNKKKIRTIIRIFFSFLGPIQAKNKKSQILFSHMYSDVQKACSPPGRHLGNYYINILYGILIQVSQYISNYNLSETPILPPSAKGSPLY